MTLRLNGSTSGYTEIDAPAVAGSNTLVLPTGNGSSGQVLSTNGSGALSFVDRMTAAGPAFGAISTTYTSLSAGVETKIIFDNEIFDTAGCFDSTANYKFTPNVAGYYQVNANVCVAGGGGAYTICSLYKNGALYSRSNTLRTSNGNYNTANTSNIIYFNGSTDYVEVYGLDPSANYTITGTPGCYFSAALIRPS